MQLYIIGGITGGIVIIVMILSLIQYSSEEYALDVDAFKDQADVMGFTRNILTNTDHSTLTNIVVDFGNYQERIPKLPSGQKLMVSPQSGDFDIAELDEVTVTTDNGIHITKKYRQAPKMPGMIGEMG